MVSICPATVDISYCFVSRGAPCLAGLRVHSASERRCSSMMECSKTASPPSLLTYDSSVRQRLSRRPGGEAMIPWSHRHLHHHWPVNPDTPLFQLQSNTSHAESELRGKCGDGGELQKGAWCCGVLVPFCRTNRGARQSAFPFTLCCTSHSCCLLKTRPDDGV